MSRRQIVGLVLTIAGVVALLWGGFFWTDRDTVLDAGPLTVQTKERKGFPVPAAVSGIVLAAGVLLLVVPSRRRI
jgi:hypothetical protein